MAKVFSILGFSLAILLLIAIMVPYVVAWLNLNLEGGKINLVNVKGINHVCYDAFYGEDYSLINVTLISIYPKAAVEKKSNIFEIQLIFLIYLNPNVIEFICDEINVYFRNTHGNIEYFGTETLSFMKRTLTGFYRRSDKGSILPFSENTSINVHPNRWPPFSQDLAHLF